MRVTKRLKPSYDMFFKVALIGRRLMNKYGIPRDVYNMMWKWIPPAPPGNGFENYKVGITNVHQYNQIVCTVGTRGSVWQNIQGIVYVGVNYLFDSKRYPHINETLLIRGNHRPFICPFCDETLLSESGGQGVVKLSNTTSRFAICVQCIEHCKSNPDWGYEIVN